jgi:hypothetical protein
MILILALVAEINIQPYYYTNTNYFYEIMAQDSIIYGATNGGIVAYHCQTGDFQVLTNTDGLQINRQQCLAFDSSGYLWAGNELGLALIDPDLSEVQIYPSEYLAGTNTQKIVCRADSVYVGSSNGLLFIQTMGTADDFTDDIRMRIREPEGLPSENVLSIAFDDTSIWVGTDNGLVRYTKDFVNYEQYSTVHGLLSDHINDIFIKDTSVYIASDNGLNIFQGSFFDTLLSSEYISDIAGLGDSLVLALDSSSQVGIYFQGVLITINNNIPYLCRVNSLLNLDGDIFCGLGNRYERDIFGEGMGHYLINSNTWDLIKNNCLPSNHIDDITANENGIFLACGTRASDSRGFAWFDGISSWTSYFADSSARLRQVHRCETALDNKVWFGLNAFPDSDSSVMLISLDPVSNEMQFLYNRYHGIDGAIAVWDIKFDDNNNMFLSLARSDKVWVIDSMIDDVYFLGDKQSGFVVEQAIDSQGRVWRTFVTDKTLLLIDTHNTLFDRSDDTHTEFTTADGLVSNYAYGCVVDHNDVLYIANESGIVIYDGSGFSAITNISTHELFDVEIDSQDRVWIMGRDGIYYYDPVQNFVDGWRYYELGVQIEFQAFSNELIQVQGFEFDPLRDCFWLAGESGLLKIAVENVTMTQLDSILIYPNPVVNSGVLRIKNLPDDAQVNIYAISGRLLAEHLLPDRVFDEVVWQIPDDIASGLYFALVRSSLYGNKVCKFAVIR